VAKRNTAINDLAEIDSLERVWDEMRKKTKSNKKNIPVSGDISVSYFEQFRSFYIKKISSEIRSGKFSFSHLRPYFIEKESGGTRVICVPTLRDRLVQRATLRLLTERGYSFSSPGSYGFVEGRSVPEACKKSAELRAEKPWVLKTDISNFFDNIPRDELSADSKAKCNFMN